VFNIGFALVCASGVGERKK